VYMYKMRASSNYFFINENLLDPEHLIDTCSVAAMYFAIFIVRFTYLVGFNGPNSVPHIHHGLQGVSATDRGG